MFGLVSESRRNKIRSRDIRVLVLEVADRNHGRARASPKRPHLPIITLETFAGGLRRIVQAVVQRHIGVVEIDTPPTFFLVDIRPIFSISGSV